MFNSKDIYMFLFVTIGCVKLITSENVCKDIHLDVGVSPPAGLFLERKIEIIWELAPAEKGDWVGLFVQRGAFSNSSQEPDVRLNATDPEGTSVSEIEDFERGFLGFKKKCLGFYVGYFDICNLPYGVKCMKTEPSWMWDLKSIIGGRKIIEVYIPGSKESASYPSITDIPKNGYFSGGQYESILNQLIYGSRYLELEVGYHTDGPMAWWAHFGRTQTHPLLSILEEIRTFVEHTKEIVILDVQKFPVGFEDPVIHDLLEVLLEAHLGDLAAPKTLNWDSTLNKVWSSKKRLIITYNEQRIAKGSNFLWEIYNRGYKKSADYFFEKIERSSYENRLKRKVNLKSQRAKDDEKTADDLEIEKIEKEIEEYEKKKNLGVLTDLLPPESPWTAYTYIYPVRFVRSRGVIGRTIKLNRKAGVCT